MVQKHNISGAVFRDMLLLGAALLEKNKALVDSLNVFPVPDGDTGTNMYMTMNAAVKELKGLDDDAVAGAIAALVAKGALRGARGNSGVILSQIFRGIARGLEGLESIDAKAFADALKSGADSAYKAVMKPKEGTILTVARHMAECAQNHIKEDINIYMLIDKIIEDGDKILDKTPEMLPVLKEAGVVDSGGKGLMFIFKGFKLALDGDNLDDYLHEEETSPAVVMANEDIMVDSLDEIEFGYCTEFFIEHLNPSFSEDDVLRLRDHLNRIGDSVVAVFDVDVVKIHVHTNVPGKALQLAIRLGEVNGIKIENMREQHRRLVEERKRREKEYGIVVISAGEGLDKVFKDLAVDAIVTGGQTMNPSAFDIEKAIKRVNARNIFVLPNNKNIILAANQAAEMIAKTLNINIIVIPTKSITQGIAAALIFNAEANVEQIKADMESAIANVKSGSVTFAVRTTSFSGHEIKEGDFMGMVDGDIVSNSESIDDVIDQMVENMMSDEGEYVTIFYGSDVEEKDAKAVADRIGEKYPDADVVLQYGGQPLYYYFISVE